MRNQIKRLILTINLVAFGFSSLSAAIEAPVNCSASFNFEKDSQFSENEMKLSAEAEFRETIVDRFEGRGKDLKIATKEMEIQNKLLSTDELHLTGSVLRLKDAIHQSFREIERDLTANSSNLRISFQNIRKQKMIDQKLEELNNSLKEMGILVAAIHNENLQLGKAHPLLMGFKADLLKYINYLDKSLANIIVSSTSSDRKLILKKLVSNEKSKFSLKMSELNQLIESIEQRQVRNILVVNQTSLLVDVDYPRFLRTSQLSIKEMDAFRVKVAEYRRLAKDYSTTALIALAVAAVGGGYAWFGGKHHKAVDAANQASQIERAQSDAAAQAATEKENASFVINSNIFVKSLKDNYPADLEKFNYLSNAKLTPEVKIAEAKNYLETHAQITPAELTLLIKNLHADDFGRFSKDEKDYYDNIVRALGLREQSQTSSYGPLLVSAIEKTNFKKSNALEIDGIISILTNKEKLLDPKVQVGFTDSDRYVIKNVLLFNYSQRNFTPEQKAAKLSVIPQKVNSNDAFSKIIKSNTSAKLKRWALLAVLDSTDSISVEDYKLIVTSYSKSTELAEDLTDRINEEYRAFANSPNFSINSAYAYESLLMFLVASTKINLTDVSMAEMEKLNAFTTQSTKELVSAGPGSELEKKSSQFLLKRFYEYKRASAIGKEN